MEYLTTVEMSKKCNISSRRIGVLCSEGRVEGRIKKGKMWLIPSEAVDNRFKVNKGECYLFLRGILTTTRDYE